MFWKRTPSSKNLEPWEILQWWRMPQEYIHWTTVDTRQPFQNFFAENKAALVEFDDEVSVLNSKSELQSVLEELWKKAKKKIDEEPKNSEFQLLLKSTSAGKSKFLVKPFLEHSKTLPFWPPKVSPINISLTCFFLENDESQQELGKRFHQYTKSLQTDQIDNFVVKQSVRLFQELLKKQDSKPQFDALIDILTHFDSIVLNSSQLVSQDYLKKVWKIPLFIFANQPEQAAFTTLLLQKSFQTQRSQIVKELRNLYFARLLHWLLFRKFNEEELGQLESFVEHDRDQEKFIQDELYPFYKKLVSRSGVPIELGELYGTEVYMERVLTIFSTFPKADEFESTFGQGELYSILLEDCVRFALRHQKEVAGSPKELLRTLIRIMISRLVEFRENKKETI